MFCYNGYGDTMKEYKYTLKTYWYFVALIVLIILILPFIIKLFHNNHLIHYSISNYQIEEEFFIEEKNHFYNFIVSKNSDTYIFSINNSYSRKKKILSSIKEYSEGNVSCVVPITKKNDSTNLVCVKDHKQVSNTLLKDDNNYKKIIENIKGFKEFEISNNSKEYEKLDVYLDNIVDKEVYYIWNYKGIYILENDKARYQKILDYDLYENIMATTVGRYYVLFDNSSVSGIEKVYYYNPDNNSLHNFKLDIKLEKDSYINGVKNNNIYVTDKRKKIQYKINIFKETIEVIGNEEDLYVAYLDGNKTLLNKSDFFMNNQIFDNVHKKVDNSSDCIYDSKYYYCLEDSIMQKRDLKNNNMSLFLVDDYTEWSIQSHEVLLLKEDTLYAYNDYYGLRKIVEYRELHYNYSNIYKLGS